MYYVTVYIIYFLVFIYQGICLGITSLQFYFYRYRKRWDKVKKKVHLEEAAKAQRKNIGIALLFP